MAGHMLAAILPSLEMPHGIGWERTWVLKSGYGPGPNFVAPERVAAEAHSVTISIDRAGRIGSPVERSLLDFVDSSAWEGHAEWELAGFAEVPVAVGSRMSEFDQEPEVLSRRTHKQPECTEALGEDWLALDSQIEVCSLLLALGNMPG